MKLRTAWLLGIGLLGTGLLSGCTVDFSTGGPACGDGVIDEAEACDDANDQAGDGCDECLVEEGWQCVGQPSDCDPACGDDLLSGNEVCDGAALDGRTCADFDFYEGALTCAADCLSFNTDGCNGFCGDGALSGPETCDGSRLGSETCQGLGHYPGSLSCTTDCAGYDLSGCGGTCGDGVVNGVEVCDGPALGGALCSDVGQFFGGPLACGPNCQAYDTSGCWTYSRVVINEVGVGDPDWVELRNLSEVAVQLNGWALEWHAVMSNGSGNDNQWVLPGYNLAAGERVLLWEDTTIGANPPVVNGAEIRFGQNIAWSVTPGSAVLLDAVGLPKDFVRWGSARFVPPPGALWTEDQAFLPAPGTPDTTMSLSRVPDGGDTDQTSDWCVTDESPGTVNATVCLPTTPPGTLLITEVHRQGGSNTWHVELHNPGAAPVDLDGWALHAGNLNAAPAYLAAHSLGPGQYLEIVDNAVTQTPYMNAGVMYIDEFGSLWQVDSLALLAPGDSACIDFVRWNNSNNAIPSPGLWSDTPAPLPAVANDDTIGRASLTDTDAAGDWCLQQASSLGAANGVCAP